MTAPKKTKERLSFTVGKGVLYPSDDYTTERLRAKGYHVGDVLSATLTKQRSPGFNRLAHQLGALVGQNIEEFGGLDAHKVLKRLQIESGVACEETAIKIPGYGMMMHRTPQSLAFDAMDEGEFRECMTGLSRWISTQYWPQMDEDQILNMASLMP